MCSLAEQRYSKQRFSSVTPMVMDFEILQGNIYNVRESGHPQGCSPQTTAALCSQRGSDAMGLNSARNTGPVGAL